MILPIEKQVTSLSLSKRLAETGLPADTYFAWWETRAGIVVWDKTQESDYEGAGDTRLAPAYTSSELLEWLPKMTDTWKDGRGLYSATAEEGMMDYFVDEMPTSAEALGELALKVKERR